MKKVISVLLVFATMFSLMVPAAAATVSTNDAGWVYEKTTIAGIAGEIIYQNMNSGDNVTSDYPENSSETSVIVSYTENSDGSYTVYQYENGSLMETHTATPGSGTVIRKYYGVNGEITEVKDVVRREPVVVSSSVSTRSSSHQCGDSQLSSNADSYPLGYMHYMHSFTGDIYSIECFAVSEQHLGQYHTFNEGTAVTLSSLVTTLLGKFPIFKNPVNIVQKIIAKSQEKGILSAVVSGIITVLVTERIRCDFYNQEIHGTATSHSGYPHIILDGTYAFVTEKGETEIVTEGYTVRDWGNSSMGRWMMYKVFGIDEAPTSWTNVDLRSLYE